MSTTEEEIRPILQPTKLPEGENTEPQVAVWFVLKDLTESSDASVKDETKESTGSKIKSFLKDNIPNASYGSGGDLLIVPIRMSEYDYSRYFEIDEETGKYQPDVKEPPEGRLAWLQKRLAEQDPKSRKVREVSGLAAKAGGVTMPGAVPALG